MLTEVGRVVAVERGSLWVESIRQTTCGSCAAQKGCGHGLMNKLSDGRRSYIRVLPGTRGLDGCCVDDQVRFAIPEEVILRGSFIAYLLPLLAMMLAAMGLSQVFPDNPDVGAAIGAVVGLALGFAAVRWHARRHRNDPHYQPVLVEVVSPHSTPVQVL